MNHLPSVAQRFLRYVQIDTQSDPESESVPSTEKQKDLGRLLVEELHKIGLKDAHMNTLGYVFATVPAVGVPSDSPVLGLLAHLDTSPDESGKDVKPIVHRDYKGEVITLPGDTSVRLDPATQPALLEHIGHDIITSDGTTLLGSDDKAGIAILMQLAEDLVDDNHTRPPIRLCFTIDEEIGSGIDHIDLEELGVDVAYTLDGSGIGNFFTETFNAVLATLTIKGIMVHPGYAKDIMVNAVRILSEFIAALPADQAPETTEEREGYLHPHKIKAGDASRCEATFILRDFTREGIENKKRYLETLVDFFRIKYPKAVIELNLEEQYKNMRAYIEETDSRVVSLAHIAAKEMGITLDEHVVRGGTDGARLSELGIPTPNVFNGGHDYHSKFEWNTVQNLETSLVYVKHLVQVWGHESVQSIN